MILKRYLSTFKKLETHDIAFFKSICNVLDTNLELYNTDWMKKYTGKAPIVLRPKTKFQVSEILKYCNENKIAVVPQGGNTGLVGGSVPVKDEIILSTQLMNNIISFDRVSGILTAEAGCILETLDNWLNERGFMMPLDLGAKGTCQIGGNVATNAGGLRLLRYGSLHGTVLSLEAVKADGTILNMGKPLRKDNTGYDLKQLMIGSEGTLGVITSVSILTAPMPKSTNVCVVGLDSFELLQKAFGLAKQNLGEILSAFEFFDRSSLDLVIKHMDGAREPFETQSPFYALIETQGSNKEHDDSKLEKFLETLLTTETITDGVMAQDNAQLQLFWSLRENITEACTKEGSVYKYDLSVPISQVYSLVMDMRDRLREAGLYLPETNSGPVKQIIGFGHMGDGNLHLNIVGEKSDNVTNAIEPFVYELTQKNEGSISAEHGLGLMKSKHIQYSKSIEMIELMKQIKQIFDPNGILNPYKYIQ